MALTIPDITRRIGKIDKSKLVEVDESFVVEAEGETYYLQRITSYRDGEPPTVVWRFSSSAVRERYLVTQEQADQLEALLGPTRRLAAVAGSN